MNDWLMANIDGVIAHAATWGFVIVFVLMAIESSFIPFPSEVVMIPAGFLAFRGELSTQIPCLDLVLSFVVGLSGSMVGAYVNYWLAVRLGRPVLYAYGKYVGLKERTLRRAEEIFNRYGEMATFVCRLLPAIRQLISIPAGLCRMPLGRFSFFTALGAGIWCLVLLGAGWVLGQVAGDISYQELIRQGTELVHRHYGKLLLGLGGLLLVYILIQRKVMRSREDAPRGVSDGVSVDA